MKRVLLDVIADHGVLLPSRTAHIHSFTPTNCHPLPCNGCMLVWIIRIHWK
jgi:hypothetical protein